jgi:membrane-associated protease RseP (regulator of RpoE activity)
VSFDVIAFIIFIILLGLVLYLKRDKLDIQKVFFPFIYLILYRTKLGLRLMDSWSKKYNYIIKLFGYCSIGFGFVGMIYISLAIFMFVLKLIFFPSVSEPGVSLVLPFTNIPGVGYLSFTHWILALFLLAIVHEFAHGVVARAWKVPVKSSGFAVLALLAPIIPAAFVEPDEKHMEKRDDVVKYSVFAAGPIANLVFAFLILLAFPFVGDVSGSTTAPYEDQITEPIGFSFETLEGDYPATLANVPNGVINGINGNEFDDYTEFYKQMMCVRPDETITLNTEEGDYLITTGVKEDDPERGFIGIKPVQNERRVKDEYTSIAPFYYWLKGFFKWLFLLNFFIGLANLLPLGIVDGGRMLQVALLKTMNNKKKAQKVWIWIGFMFLFALVFSLVVNYFGNPFMLFR